MLLRRSGTLRHSVKPSTQIRAYATQSRLQASATSRLSIHSRWPLTISATAFSLALLASLGLINGRQTIHAEAKEQKPKKSAEKSSPAFTKDDVSLLCLIGYPQSGKSLQATNLEKRWGNDGWQVINVSSLDELRNTIESKKKKGKQLSFIVDGFPRSWEEAQAVEREICEIFCYAFFNLEQDEWVKKSEYWRAKTKPECKVNDFPSFHFTAKGLKQDYEKLERKLKPLREGPREKANILEIVAGWPEDEVWEMVEAKVEQVIELRDRGEM